MKNIFFSCAVCLVLTFYTNICIKLEFNTSDRFLCLLLISSICKNSQRNLMIRKMLVRGPRTSVCSKAGQKVFRSIMRGRWKFHRGTNQSLKDTCSRIYGLLKTVIKHRKTI